MNTPEETYETPAITDIASVEELTMAGTKIDNASPDGFKYHHIVLTS